MYHYNEKDGHNIYDWLSVVEKDRIYFSGYPTGHEFVNALKKEGFTRIVNLTTPNDFLPTYLHVEETIPCSYYPIQDHQVPNDLFSFIDFTHSIRMEYYHDHKILIHCKAGKGRSSMLCILLLCMIGYTYDDALHKITESYNTRLHRMDYTYVSPLRLRQLTFLQKTTREIYIDLNCTKYTCKYYNWLTLSEAPELYYSLLRQLDTESPNTNKIYGILYNYLYDHLINNKELFYKLKFTYMKRFVITSSFNSPSQSLLSVMYTKILHRLRELTITVY